MVSLALFGLLWIASLAVYARGNVGDYLPKVAANLSVTIPPVVNPPVTSVLAARLPATIRVVRPPSLPGNNTSFQRYECPTGLYFLGWASECVYFCSQTPHASAWMLFFHPPMMIAAENKPCPLLSGRSMRQGTCQYQGRYGLSCQ